MHQTGVESAPPSLQTIHQNYSFIVLPCDFEMKTFAVCRSQNAITVMLIFGQWIDERMVWFCPMIVSSTSWILFLLQTTELM